MEQLVAGLDGCRAERLASLRTVFSDIDDHAGSKIKGASRDDVLDAFVAAWTARRYALGIHRQLGGDTDERGLRMEMIA
jgi:predicted RNase H-like nuclease